MKILLRTTILLLLCVHMVLPAAVIVKRGLSADQKDKFIDSINNYRQVFAKSNNIGNMHEIQYDSALEALANKMSGCDINSGDYRIMYGKKTSGIEQNDYFQHPTQTKVACSELTTNCNDYSRGDLICLVGPHNSDPSESDIKRGPSGTHCLSGQISVKSLCTGGGGSGGGGGASGNGTKTENFSTANFYGIPMYFSIAYLIGF